MVDPIQTAESKMQAQGWSSRKIAVVFLCVGAVLGFVAGQLAAKLLGI